VLLQGFGLQLSPFDLGKPAFRDALMEVVANPKYAEGARALAVKIKARKRTPVQEAAGTLRPCFTGILVFRDHP
jgi:hypothetical protein